MTTGDVATFSVASALDRLVAQKETPREHDGLWHPSGLYGCQRKAIYAILGTAESNPTDARGKRVFFVGHVIHDLIQQAVRSDLEHGVLLAAYEELPIVLPELGVAGSADQLVQLANGRWVLLEYKSIKTISLRYKDLPQDEHVMQAATYMLALRTVGSADGRVPPLGDSLDVARICYVSKDDAEVYEKHVIWSPTLENRVRHTLEELEPYRKEGRLPPRLPLVTKKSKTERAWQCNYCPFTSKCWDEDPA